jgi:hypothetical protein
VRRAPVALALAVVLLLAVTPARAQDGPGTTGDVPPVEIIPEPNSGEAPEEAGDRGGALQLTLLAVVTVAVAGGAWHISRQVRRTRGSVADR